MKFTVQSSTTHFNKIRIGHLSQISRIPNTVLITPLLLLYSKGGSVTHLTREVLESVTNLSNHAIQIPVSNSAQCCQGSKHFKEGISSFAGLNECLSYCTVQDPAEVTKVGYNDKNSVTIWTTTGRKLLPPDKYMDMIEALRPDMYHVLCDGDTNVESSRKRSQKAVDVSTTMFLACAERHAQSKSLKNSVLLAVLEGGYNLDARQQSAQMFSQHPLVQGFVIDGLHNNGPEVEQMTYETIQPVITETLKHLPEDKVRVIHGCWRPDVVLELVRAGVDVFDSSLVYLVTERGSALTFSYRVQSLSSREGDPLKCEAKTVINNGESTNSYEINLKEKVYFDDFSPILSGCGCLACTKHTRAYIHHLLNVKEMLASVLLMIHNLHHYEQFFEAIRQSGKSGQLITIDPPLS